MSQSTWIHIGFPKCASTSLQRGLFSQCPEIDYVGRSDNWKQDRPSCHGPLLALETLDQLHYRPRKQEIQDQILAGFKRGDAQVRVVSDEMIVATYRPYLRGIPVADACLIAERLHGLFPDAKILMVIWNQITFLSSLLVQLMRNNLVHYDFFDFVESHRHLAEKGHGSCFYWTFAISG